MDAFWLIPLAIVGAIFLVVFYARIKRQPSSSSEPHVLVDKPSGEPAIDEATRARDWAKRPCGSFLDWFYGRK